MDYSTENKAKLLETKSRWVMPVLQKSTLERLLNVPTDNYKEKPEDFHQMSQIDLRCFPELIISFKKILDDPDIDDWEPYMHDDVNAQCKKLVELCVYSMDEDSIPVLDALALVLNPDKKFHKFNAARKPESVPSSGGDISDQEVYARPLPNPEEPRGWLVDLLNRFGNLGGFLVLLTRFQLGRRTLTLRMIHALIRPFKLCSQLLTVDTIDKYFVPIVERVPAIVKALTYEELMAEAKVTSISCELITAILYLEHLVKRLPEHTEMIQNLESLEWGMITHIDTGDLSTSNSDLDNHSEQWDALLQEFQSRRLTGDEESYTRLLGATYETVKNMKDSAVVPQLLAFLWDSTFLDDVATKIMEKALSIHVKTLTYYSPQYWDTQLIYYLDKSVEKLTSDDKWAVPMLQQIEKICQIYETREIHLPIVGKDIARRLEEKHGVVDLIINSLIDYMGKVREHLRHNPTLDQTFYTLCGPYDHTMQVKTRLDVLNYLVRLGGLTATMAQVTRVWHSLVKQRVFDSDTKLCLDWLYEVISTFPRFNPADVEDFLVRNFLQLYPKLLTSNGFEGLQLFLKDVNTNSDYTLKIDNLIGVDYLWRIVTKCPEEIARLAFKQLKKINYDVGSQLNWSSLETHRVFIDECTTRLQIVSSTLSRFAEVEDIEDDDERMKKIARKTQIMGQLMKFLQEYIEECGWGSNQS